MKTAGRRERKKAERRAEILKRGRELFDRNGFEATSVEAIAEAADVSPGTVYNFFPAKIDLLMESLLTEVAAAALSELRGLGPPAPDPAAGMLALARAQLTAVRRLPRQDLRLVVAEAIARGAAGAAGRAFAALEDSFEKEAARRLGQYQRLGKLAADADPDRLARVLACLIRGEFHLWLAGEGEQEGSPEARLADDLGVLLR
ncbi:MAG TPA: helix-turn-helix domain-containing protein [Caulobacteraceae bacterium]|nr:helix-turn-helix domain-containing protein [Caulobacteraceae bacterium]